MTDFEIKALIEGAYSQMPTLPGFWIKYEDFRKRFNELVAERTEMPLDVESLLKTMFPEAKYEECYKPKDSEEVFRAFRIAPNRLKVIAELKRKIEIAIGKATCDEDGWFNFATIGLHVTKEDYQPLGFVGLRQAVECILKHRIEFRIGDPSRHEAPVKARVLSRNAKQDSVPTIPTRVSRETIRKRQGSYIGDAIDKYAYFPKSKGAINVLGWDAAINDLATNIALEERWYYNEEDKLVKPILKNYLSYTFERLQYEDSLEKEKAQIEGRQPRLKILENAKNAIFNTGLVDSIFDPIYAIFKRNDGSNPSVSQLWIFVAFATANSYYQNIITDFPYKPVRAEYFTNPSDLYYDCNAQKPTINWQHIIKDNIERLPMGFIKQGATNGFSFIDDVSALPKPQQRAYYSRLADAIYQDDDWLQFLTTKFKNALDIALGRVAWNYKTAIPVYYVTDHKLSLLLPLALEKRGIIDVALVCEHKVDEQNGVNNYVGKTIFTLQMAYNNARLITRPDSDWLMAEMCITK